MQAPEISSNLVVDHDSKVIRIRSHILGDFSRLFSVKSGRTPLKLDCCSIPDVVLLDIDRPDRRGFEVLKNQPALVEVRKTQSAA